MTYSRFTLQTELITYLPIPRDVMRLSLPFSAVVLYGLLLNRGTLSQKHGYADESGWIYVVYPVLELSEAMNISPTSVKKNLKILEQAGLIHRFRHSRTEANRTYLLVPEDSLTATGRETGRVRKGSSEGRKTVLRRETLVAPSNLKKQLNLSNLYQHKQEESL